MPQWGKTDASSNIVYWGAQILSQGSGPVNKAANNTAMFGNTTASAFVPNQTVGIFGVTDDESQATPGIKAPGWVLVRTGTGGRAGRVTYETLVAISSMTSDADSTTIPNAILTFTSQPANASANATASQTAVFTAVVAAAPPSAAVTYQWQANSGSGFANVSDGAVYGNSVTSALTVLNVTGLNSVQYRLNAFSTGAVNATSSTATLTVTT